MSEQQEEDKILVFTRMPADGFDDFMSDPEVVLATVEDMGFDQDEMMKSMSGGDPSQLVQLMEGRWSGEEANFAFESYWDLLLEKLPEHKQMLDQVLVSGRKTQIYTDFSEIRVLSPDQVTKIHNELVGIQLPDPTPGLEADMMLDDLFPAMQKFLGYACEGSEFVLVSWL